MSSGAVVLSNGTRIPRIGLGVYEIPDGEPTLAAVRAALEAGYRHVDTAKLYRNEASVGRAVRESGIAREEVFVTTKLWPTEVLRPARALDASLARLGLDYVDLYLVHWPVPGLWRSCWGAMEQLAVSGKARAIGVSNHSADQLAVLLDRSEVPPAVDQVRCSPFELDRPLYDLCRSRGVCFEAYSPLTRGKRLGDHRLDAIARRVGCTPAQLLIAWSLAKGMVAIPKSANEGRIRENLAATEVELGAADLAELDALGAPQV